MAIEALSSAQAATYQRMDAVPNIQVQHASAEEAVPTMVELKREQQSRQEDPTQKEAEHSKSQEVLRRAVESVNKKYGNSEALFGIHEKTNRVTIKIVDKETKEVIREYPPEKTLDMIAKAWELAGLFVDKRR